MADERNTQSPVLESGKERESSANGHSRSALYDQAMQDAPVQTRSQPGTSGSTRPWASWHDLAAALGTLGQHAAAGWRRVVFTVRAWAAVDLRTWARRVISPLGALFIVFLNLGLARRLRTTRALRGRRAKHLG